MTGQGESVVAAGSVERASRIEASRAERPRGRGPRHRRRPRHGVRIATVGAVAALVVVAPMAGAWRAVGAVSVVHGVVPALVVTLAVASVLLVLARAPRPLVQLGLGIPATALVLLVFIVTMNAARVLPGQFPGTDLGWYCGWFGLFVFSLVGAGIDWRRSRTRRRVAAVGSVVLTLGAAATVLNRDYDYYPTVATLFGVSREHPATLPQLEAVRATVARSGRLPRDGVTLALPVPGTVSRFRARDGLVYLPPAWFGDPTPRLPAVVLLPGTPGTPADWTRAGLADRTADHFADAHGGRAPVIAIVDPNGSFAEDTECVDSRLGHVETYLTVDVPRFLRATFHVATGSRSMAVAGLSETGTCALTLALRHPRLYPVFADYSGFADPTYQADGIPQSIQILFAGSAADFAAHDPAALLRAHRYPGLSGWFENGREDGGRLLDARTVWPEAAGSVTETCFLVRPGGHSFGLWAQAFADSLPWMSAELQLTPPPRPIPADCNRISPRALPPRS